MKPQQAAKVRRSWNTIYEGPLWPSQGLCANPEESRRHMAIYHVLQRIPPKDYKTLAASAYFWEWYIPHWEALAMVYPFAVTAQGELRPVEPTMPVQDGRIHIPKAGFTRPSAVVLYLSPRLELVGWNIIVACVAHELAHLCLKHRLIPGGKTAYDAQEEEAWALIAKWGFGKEAAMHAARAKQIDTARRQFAQRLAAKRSGDAEPSTDQKDG
jgi:hypothetical protein